ncbi:hypothetical protein PV325_001781 [Microctonus aethiopoides]|uniref:TIL domain-containing protein n=1 Tax=Microctonus aethiopoides TaxID=144406 RepID=A0AA39KQM0_9HYME|nr:hypothetical protein PV325_001781 [Microctonus aethiopoides]KAK0093269.1 hypothetical protein PV326_013926 [Microctonus aethiopoides]KAK0170260.1 hypothetical protein PV328_010840 [Microctonus aethiopoides]
MTRITFILFALCLFYIYADALTIIDCGPNADPAPCGSSCESTCKDPRIKMCKVNPDTCPTECRCQEGFVRNERTDQCIPPNQCPKKSCRNK